MLEKFPNLDYETSSKANVRTHIFDPAFNARFDTFDFIHKKNSSSFQPFF